MKHSILFENGKLYVVELPDKEDLKYYPVIVPTNNPSKLKHRFYDELYKNDTDKALANKVEVKNPELIPGLLESVNRTAWMLTIPQDKILKDGDTFDLPADLTFDKETGMLKRIEPETLIRGSNVFGGISKEELDLVFEYSKCGIYHNCAHKQEDLDSKLKILEKVKHFTFEPENPEESQEQLFEFLFFLTRTGRHKEAIEKFTIQRKKS